jgi:hypothetical protein
MPLPVSLTPYLGATVGWRGIWILIGIGALIVFLLRFSLAESPRWLATHGKGQQALAILARMGLPGPKEQLSTDAASDTKSDPFVVVWRNFPVRVLAGMICFSAFFGVAIGLGTWLPNIMNSQGFSITKSLQYTFGVALAVPFASLFMMYALDNFGRKITSTIAFFSAGLIAIVRATSRARSAWRPRRHPLRRHRGDGRRSGHLPVHDLFWPSLADRRAVVAVTRRGRQLSHARIVPPTPVGARARSPRRAMRTRTAFMSPRCQARKNLGRC